MIDEHAAPGTYIHRVQQHIASSATIDTDDQCSEIISFARAPFVVFDTSRFLYASNQA
jgi:hypothetical protein